MARPVRPTEDSIEWDAAYTAELVVHHLCLLEDHLLAFSRDSNAHCLSCIYWHCVKLIGYSTLEAPKFFNAKDQAVFKAITDLAVTVRDRREEMMPAEALKYKDQVRELRYQVAGMKAYEFGGEAVLADLSGVARLLLGGAEMGEKMATLTLPMSKWRVISNGVDKLLNLEAKQEKRAITKVESALLNIHLVNIEDSLKLSDGNDLSEAAGLLLEAAHLSATPEYVEIYKSTIHAHYKGSDKFHPDSIRMLKTTKRIRTTVGCPLTSDYKGDKCSTTQQVISIIMPKTKRYLNRVKNYQSNGATIIRKEREEGIEPRLSDDKEFQEVLEALKPENIVEVEV